MVSYVCKKCAILTLIPYGLFQILNQPVKNFNRGGTCKGFTGCLPHFIFGFSLNYPHVPSNSINLLT